MQILQDAWCQFGVCNLKDKRLCKTIFYFNQQFFINIAFFHDFRYKQCQYSPKGSGFSVAESCKSLLHPNTFMIGCMTKTDTNKSLKSISSFDICLFGILSHVKNCENQINIWSRIIFVVNYSDNKTSITSVCIKNLI